MPLTWCRIDSLHSARIPSMDAQELMNMDEAATSQAFKNAVDHLNSVDLTHNFGYGRSYAFVPMDPRTNWEVRLEENVRNIQCMLQDWKTKAEKFCTTVHFHPNQKHAAAEESVVRIDKLLELLPEIEAGCAGHCDLIEYSIRLRSFPTAFQHRLFPVTGDNEPRFVAFRNTVPILEFYDSAKLLVPVINEWKDEVIEFHKFLNTNTRPKRVTRAISRFQAGGKN